jgi:ATP-binding cassette, subfamily C, bacterial
LGVANQAFSVLPTLLSALSLVLLLSLGGLRVIEGHLSIGMLVAFQSLMLSFQTPVNNLVNFGATLQELEGSLVRLDDVLNNPTNINSSDIVSSKKITSEQEYLSYFRESKLQGYIELRNIYFGYNPLVSSIIKDFNLIIKPGERIAIVGGSGSGKSSIAKLISGLYQPWSGEILFDGKTRQEIPQELLTNSISMVEQDILLFSGTIRDNLTLWDTTISDANLLKACEDAAIADVIFAMTSGFDANLIEGATNLSGGQRQRLEIARALVNNPSILIMDEATSALDAETEKIIHDNLQRRGCTCILIAHRLSTIRDCDSIIVLEKGQIVEQGSHQDLLKNFGAYSRLIGNEV